MSRIIESFGETLVQENDCPPILRPQDGECPEYYPYNFKTYNDYPCCYKEPVSPRIKEKIRERGKEAKAIIKLRKIRQKRKSQRFDWMDLKKIEQYILEQNERIKQAYDEIWSEDYDEEDEQRIYYEYQVLSNCPKLMNYIFPVEDNYFFFRDLYRELFNRGLKFELTDDLCNLYYSELPSQEWVDKQKEYINNLPDKYQSILRLYSQHGDQALNSFIRNDFKVSDTLISYIKENPNFQQYFDYTYFNSFQEYLMEFYNIIQEIILNAPRTDKRIVVYRGVKSLHYNYFSGTTQYIYQNKGIISTSIDVTAARSFSLDIISVPQYLNKIIIPKGYPCLFNVLTFYITELEIILPDQSVYYMTKELQSKPYIRSVRADTVRFEYIKTNESVLIK